MEWRSRGDIGVRNPESFRLDIHYDDQINQIYSLVQAELMVSGLGTSNVSNLAFSFPFEYVLPIDPVFG